mmetsp:Transcript_17263/g.12337  ORF Transcript_17263/g.12337 Transcript_17263/m.12337 type:complete len:132 (+) Transcript_17263:1334-1729(+)
MILQKSTVKNFRKLEIKKNRFDGEVGEVNLAFNGDNKRYFEITELEKRDILLTGGSIQKLKEKRIEQYGVVEPLAINFAAEQDKAAKAIPKPKIKANLEADTMFYKKVKQSQKSTSSLRNKDMFYESLSEG